MERKIDRAVIDPQMEVSSSKGLEVRQRFNSSRFIEDVLAAELESKAFFSRMAGLTEYQQMQVLLRLLTLWRMEEKEQRDIRRKEVRHSKDENAAAPHASEGATAYDDSDYGMEMDDTDVDDPLGSGTSDLSDNMLRVFSIVGAAGG